LKQSVRASQCPRDGIVAPVGIGSGPGTHVAAVALVGTAITLVLRERHD
jgi:hypothetical protein